MKKSDKAEATRFLKRIIVFCFGYIILFTIVMTVAYFTTGDYPETLATLTFGYFGIEIVISAVIKVFEPFKKSKSVTYESQETYTSVTGDIEPPDMDDINTRRQSHF